MLGEGQKLSKVGEEEGLKVRLMGLETKQGHLIKKNEKLCKVIAKKEQQILDLERTTEENQKSLIKAQDEFFKVKEENIRFQEKLKSSLT